MRTSQSRYALETSCVVMKLMASGAPLRIWDERKPSADVLDDEADDQKGPHTAVGDDSERNKYTQPPTKTNIVVVWKTRKVDRSPWKGVVFLLHKRSKYALSYRNLLSRTGGAGAACRVGEWRRGEGHNGGGAAHQVTAEA